MFNCIVGATFDGHYGSLDASRFLEGLVADERPDTSTLLSLPTLVTPERNRDSNDHSQQFARLGHVAELVTSGGSTRFRFTPNDIPALDVDAIYHARAALGMGEWSLDRTCWSLPSGDLFRALAEQGLLGSQHHPTAFSLPHVRPEPDRIAVMMPFSADFVPVWKALQEVAEDGGWVCERADSFWENAKVLDDVVLLIARASVVICDLTGRNANVFYETGLAHMLGRPTLLLAQSDNDIPFDLQAERHQRYLPNAEGIADLKVALGERLRTMRRASRQA